MESAGRTFEDTLQQFSMVTYCSPGADLWQRFALRG
jgi:hypothetical protein